MALVAPLRSVDQEAGVWPELCAKTGVPTTVTMDLPVVSRPRWPWLLLPLSLTATLVVRAFAKEVRTCRVAISPAAWEHHRHAGWATTALGVLGVALALGLLGSLSLALLVVFGTLALRVQVERATWLSAEYADGTFFLRGVHPAFVAAAVELERSDDATEPAAAGLRQ